MGVKYFDNDFPTSAFSRDFGFTNSAQGPHNPKAHSIAPSEYGDGLAHGGQRRHFQAGGPNDVVGSGGDVPGPVPSAQMPGQAQAGMPGFPPPMPPRPSPAVPASVAANAARGAMAMGALQGARSMKNRLAARNLGHTAVPPMPQRPVRPPRPAAPTQPMGMADGGEVGTGKLTEADAPGYIHGGGPTWWRNKPQYMQSWPPPRADMPDPNDPHAPAPDLSPAQLAAGFAAAMNRAPSHATTPPGHAKGGFHPGGEKGKLHRELGVPEGEKIGAARVAAETHSRNPEIRRDAIRAKTMSKWHHGSRKRQK